MPSAGVSFRPSVGIPYKVRRLNFLPAKVFRNVPTISIRRAHPVLLRPRVGHRIAIATYLKWKN